MTKKQNDDDYAEKALGKSLVMAKLLFLEKGYEWNTDIQKIIEGTVIGFGLLMIRRPTSEDTQ